MKNIIGTWWFKLVVSVLLAWLLYIVCPPCLSKDALLGILVGLLVIVNFSQWLNKLPLITHISRVLTGTLFVFSGFIKANDPLGFSYKLEEYFEVFKGDTGWSIFDAFAHISLELAIFICALEMILGFTLLIGYKVRLTLWLLLLQIIFFTFLTFYSACYNKVTHCGCFGDFIPLRAWQSFWKDIALLFLITILWVTQNNIRPLFVELFSHTIAVMAVIVSFFIPIYAYNHLPYFDFRPYHKGANILEQMKPGKNYQPPVYETILKYKNLKTGEVKDFTLKDYPWQDTLNWQWVATENKLVKEAVDAPKITDFSIKTLDDANITDSILNNPNYQFWIICYDLKKTDTDEKTIAKLRDLYTLAQKDNVPVVIITASGRDEIETFKSKTNLKMPFLNADGIVLKTMIRSNPGIILIKHATIIDYWHYNDLPSYSVIKESSMK
ncbi:MAG: DoxX family protein [Bacteroidetes bacterium]|nr:MAG: DoxX family protein [Bacteroidota bacterium]